MAKKGKIGPFVSIEIGTASLKGIVANYDPDTEKLEICAAAQVANENNIRKARIHGSPRVREKVASLINKLKTQYAHVEFPSTVSIAVTGNHIKTRLNEGNKRLGEDSGEERVVLEDDVYEVQSKAMELSLSSSSLLLHECLFPIGLYSEADGGEASKKFSREEVIGRRGREIETKCLFVYGDREMIKSSMELINGYYEDDELAINPFFSGLASGLAVFDKAELLEGALVIDIGAGVTEFAVFQRPGCSYAGEIDVGCDHLINDLMIGLDCSEGECSRILRNLRRNEGTVFPRQRNTGRKISIERIGEFNEGEAVSLDKVERIIELRLGEIFDIICKELRRMEIGFDFPSGIRICGGAANIQGIEDLAEHVFAKYTRYNSSRKEQLCVSLGIPTNIVFDDEHRIVESAEFATPVGLVWMEVFQQEHEARDDHSLLSGFARNIYSCVVEGFQNLRF